VFRARRVEEGWLEREDLDVMLRCSWGDLEVGGVRNAVRANVMRSITHIKPASPKPYAPLPPPLITPYTPYTPLFSALKSKITPVIANLHMFSPSKRMTQPLQLPPV